MKRSLKGSLIPQNDFARFLASLQRHNRPRTPPSADYRRYFYEFGEARRASQEVSWGKRLESGRMKQVRTHTGGGIQELREDTVRRGNTVSSCLSTRYIRQFLLKGGKHTQKGISKLYIVPKDLDCHHGSRLSRFLFTICKAPGQVILKIKSSFRLLSTFQAISWQTLRFLHDWL